MSLLTLGPGIYILPGYTIPLALGGLIHYYCKVHMRVSELTIITVASALVLGAGMFNVINIVMAVAGVPHL